MRSLGLDLGEKKTGIAVSDPQGVVALPLGVTGGRDEEATIDHILKLIEQYSAEYVVVGLPYSLSGHAGQQADRVTAFVEKLLSRAKAANINHVNIQFWDERLSTVAAERSMDEAGTKRKNRGKHRDAIAAAFILQGFLDSVRR